MTTAPKLEPCPWCGSHKTVAAQSPVLDRTWRVSCQGCWAAGPPAATKEGAATTWNRAAPSAGLREEVIGEIADEIKRYTEGLVPSLKCAGIWIEDHVRSLTLSKERGEVALPHQTIARDE